jgi:hypothetical protein
LGCTLRQDIPQFESSSLDEKRVIAMKSVEGKVGSAVV